MPPAVKPKVDVFVIDPPWPKRKGGVRRVRPMQGKQLDYGTMSVGDVFSLLDARVFPLAAPRHSVFLWGVDQFLHDGESAMLTRGYRLHARLVWDKGNGVAPAFSVRYSHEYLSWFYRPTFTPMTDEQRGKFTTVIRAPGREHSRKPDEAYRMIELFWPSAVRMDVFSRERRDGWMQFGDQTDHFGGR